MVHSLLSGLPNLVDGNDTVDSDPSVPGSNATKPCLLSPELGNAPGDDQIISSTVTRETRRDRLSDSLCETVGAGVKGGSTEKDVLPPSDSNNPSATSENNLVTIAGSHLLPPRCLRPRKTMVCLWTRAENQ